MVTHAKRQNSLVYSQPLGIENKILNRKMEKREQADLLGYMKMFEYHYFVPRSCPKPKLLEPAKTTK